MTTTTQLRSWWSPACKAKGPVYLPAYRALDACLVAHGYKLRQADTGAYNCRTITGGTGYSLHSYGPGARFTFTGGVSVTTALAVDLNWSTNPYGPRLVTDMPRRMTDAIKAVRTNNGKQVWRWGGDYRGNKDAMHFEVTCRPADLATGIDPTTLPQPKPVPAPKPPTDPPKDDAMFTYEYDAAGKTPNILVLVAGGKQVRITNNTVLQRRRGAAETHLGPVDKSEYDAFEDAYGPIVNL